MPTDVFYESREWLDLRYRVLKKSGGCCELCGSRGLDTSPLHCDHIEPRSKSPHLALVESNIQVLCGTCNMGKSNKDNTNWKFAPSRELTDMLARKTGVLEIATPEQKAKLEQLGWLRRNDINDATRKEAEKQYKALWQELELVWLEKGSQ